MKSDLAILFCVLILQSCISKKDVLYLQDSNSLETAEISFEDIFIQTNDILKITVGSLIPEAAVPYNKASSATFQANSIDIMKLEGYMVSNKQTIEFPVLGEISVVNKTTLDLAKHIKNRLEKGGHLVNPTVDVRLLNAKFTVLGEVNNPGTFNYTEANLNVIQAIGYAGDLTINGERENILLVREENNIRKISHINLKSGEWMNTDLYQVKPNDVIIVNPNQRMIKGSGLVDTGTFLAIASLTLSVVILLTR